MSAQTSQLAAVGSQRVAPPTSSLLWTEKHRVFSAKGTHCPSDPTSWAARCICEWVVITVCATRFHFKVLPRVDLALIRTKVREVNPRCHTHWPRQPIGVTSQFMSQPASH